MAFEWRYFSLGGEIPIATGAGGTQNNPMTLFTAEYPVECQQVDLTCQPSSDANAPSLWVLCILREDEDETALQIPYFVWTAPDTYQIGEVFVEGMLSRRIIFNKVANNDNPIRFNRQLYFDLAKGDRLVLFNLYFGSAEKTFIGTANFFFRSSGPFYQRPRDRICY
jgi:hypothetical protein